MANVNSVVVSGNLTRDPEVKWESEDGSSAIVNLGIAVNRSRKNDEGEYVDEVSFLNIDVFGKFAKLCARKLRKGEPATVSGRLEEQRWETDGGEKRSVVKIVAEQIDSPAFFKRDDEVAALDGGAEAEAAPAPQGQLAKDDDIPF